MRGITSQPDGPGHDGRKRGLFTALYMILVRVTPFFSLCDVREQQSLDREGRA